MSQGSSGKISEKATTLAAIRVASHENAILKPDVL